MKKYVVIINGNGGVGKDTFVKSISKYKKVKQASTVDIIKKAASILGYEESRKDEKDRKFLADLKFLATEYNNSPLEYIHSKYLEFLEDDNEILFLFIREIKEIEYAKNKYNAITLLITNSNTKFITTNEADKNVLNYEYDYIIDNTDLSNIDSNAKQFIEKIMH